MRPPKSRAKAWIPLTHLKRNPDNPRTISDEQLLKLSRSVETFTKMLSLKPLIVRLEDNTVLDGNMRHLAMERLGWTEIPLTWVTYAENLTPAEERELIIKSNLAYGQIEWGAIFDGWEDLNTLQDWGLEIKWSAEPEPDHVTKARAEHIRHTHIDNVRTNIRPGDVIQIGDHELMCGSSTDHDQVGHLLSMGGDRSEQIDLVLTDPPYNINYLGGSIENDNMTSHAMVQFATQFINTALPHTKPGTPWYVFYATGILDWPLAMRNELGIRQSLIYELIWKKNQLTLGQSDYHYKHEGILYSWTPGGAHPWYGDRRQTTVLEFEKPRHNDVHPTMKPIDLLEYLIRNSSKPGDVIYDGFGGSGSTMLAAHITGRVARLMELDERYCQVIVDRMEDFDPTIPITINSEPYVRPEEETVQN